MSRIVGCEICGSDFVCKGGWGAGAQMSEYQERGGRRIVRVAAIAFVANA